MDWGTGIQLTLAILGAAMIVGGIVAYRGSARTGVRAFSASAVAAGVVMWLIVVSVTSTSSSGTAPEPVVVTSAESSGTLAVSEQTFSGLLTAGDVEQLLTAEVPLTTTFRDFKDMAENVDPAQVVSMDSWFGLTIETDGDDGMTFTLIDFDSPTSADARFEKMRFAKKAIPEREASFGGSSYSVSMGWVSGACSWSSGATSCFLSTPSNQKASRRCSPWKASNSLPRSS